MENLHNKSVTLFNTVIILALAIGILGLITLYVLNGYPFKIVSETQLYYYKIAKGFIKFLFAVGALIAIVNILEILIKSK